MASAVVLLAAALAPAFRSRLDAADAARYASPGSAPPTGVAVSFRTVARDRTRFDVLVLAGDRLPRWKWTDAGLVTTGRVTLRAPAGATALLVATDAAGRRDHRLDGPFSWPAEPAERLAGERAARAVGGRSPLAAPPSELHLPGIDPRVDPLCESDDAGEWQCAGVPRDFSGSVVSCRGSVVTGAAAVRPGVAAEAPLRPLSFGALLRIDLAEPELPAPAVLVRVLRTAAPGDLVRRADPSWTVSYLGGGLAWIDTASPSPQAVIEAGAPGYSTKRFPIGSEEGRCTDPIPVVLSRAVTLRGSVTDRDGSPLPEALVLARSRDRAEDAGVLGEAETDANGEFEMPGLEPGNYRVRACHGEHGCVEEPANTDVPMVLRLAGGSAFVGRVLSSGGVPLAGAAVRILPSAENWATADDRLKRLPLESRSGADGRFRISAPDNGDFLVEARTESSGVARTAVRRSNLSPPVTDLGDILLQEPIDFTARVAGCDAGWLLLSGPLGGETTLPALVRYRLDAGGSGSVRLLERGAWAAWASCAGGVDSIEPAILPDAGALAGLEVRFERTGR
jgi:hypothetical protein